MVRFLQVLVLVVVCVLPSGCTAFLAEGTWRYRMTVEIETPEGLKTGTAVREVWAQEMSRMTTEAVPQTKVTGEAVVVDLGERGVVFALLRGTYGVDFAHRVAAKAFPGKPGGMGYTPEGIDYYEHLKDVKTDLQIDNMPMMVTFGDMNDPTSVELVYKTARIQNKDEWTNPSYEATDNFERLFGKGVRLKRVTLEMTDDPVTTGVLKWLPWLPEYRNKMLDGDKTWYAHARLKLANMLSSGDFALFTVKDKNNER